MIIQVTSHRSFQAQKIFSLLIFPLLSLKAAALFPHCLECFTFRFTKQNKKLHARSSDQVALESLISVAASFVHPVTRTQWLFSLLLSPCFVLKFRSTTDDEREKSHYRLADDGGAWPGVEHHADRRRHRYTESVER